MSECVILFSGGSDSFCTAALATETFDVIHLLTFYEEGTKNSPLPMTNVNKLREKYKNKTFHFSVFNIDKTVKFLCYHDYLNSLLKFKLLNLATPGLSSLSWHLTAIMYCQKNSIRFVFDGMTKELLHLPGHMPEIRNLFTELYLSFHITFKSLVIDWDVPEDQRFVDRLIVDRHGFALSPTKPTRTTGQWLYEQNLLPSANVKGSNFDRLMQHDCYPFIVYNMMVFWYYEPLIGYEKYKERLIHFFKYKIAMAKNILENTTIFNLPKSDI